MKYIETEQMELKRIYNESFEKEVVSFLNTNGGIIYLGVNDDGTIHGISDLDETMKKIANVIVNNILPNPQDLISIVAKLEEDKWIIEVKISKGSDLYYISKYGRSSKGCYVRIGTSCCSMTEEQIEKIFIKKWNYPRNYPRKNYIFN